MSLCWGAFGKRRGGCAGAARRCPCQPAATTGRGWAAGGSPREPSSPRSESADSRRRHRFKANEPWARSRGCFTSLPPRGFLVRRRRGPAQGHTATPAGSQKKGMQQASSSLRVARNFSLFFLSCCFLFIFARETEECFALQTAERWGGKDNIQGLKKLAIAWRISLKNCSEIFCSSLIEVNKVQ